MYRQAAPVHIDFVPSLVITAFEQISRALSRIGIAKKCLWLCNSI